MKNILLVFAGTLMINSLSAQGLTKNGQITATTTTYVSNTGAIGTATGVDANGKLISTLSIGDTYQGGKIAYILVSGDPGYSASVVHGLIVETTDLQPGGGAPWGCYSTTTQLTGADGVVIGTGNQNTIDITTGCLTAGIAAKLCADLSLNGYTDWYLPSVNELYKLYLNMTAIGGFSSAPYWSSSESGSQNAYAVFFYSGAQGPVTKTNNYFVRAIRSF